MLYNLSLPKVMMLYVIQVPQGPLQTCHYDNGMGDVLPVPLGTIAFVLGKTIGSFKVPINDTIICSIIVIIKSFFAQNVD